MTVSGCVQILWVLIQSAVTRVVDRVYMQFYTYAYLRNLVTKIILGSSIGVLEKFFP